MRKERSTAQSMLFLVMACAVFAGVLLAPFPSIPGRDGQMLGLAHTARLALAILGLVVTLWVTEAMPFAASGLLGMALTAVLGVMDWQDVAKAGFGNDIVLFFIGVMALSSAVVRSGLGERIAGIILRRAGSSPGRTLFGFLLVGCLASMWVTDMAVAGMMLPLAVAVLRANGMRPGESNFGKALTMACAWGAIIGGIGTPAGAGPNPLVIGFLKDLLGVRVTFAGWMVVGVPAALLMLVPCWVLLMKAFPPEVSALNTEGEAFRSSGPLNAKEIWTLAGFAIMAFLWVGGDWITRVTHVPVPMSLTPIIGAVVFFLPSARVLTWKEAEEDMDWGGLILIAAGISMGSALYSTGVATYMANALFNPVIGMPVFARAFALSFGLALFKVVFSSNTVTASIVMPVLAATIAGSSENAWELTAAAGLTSSLAFILVTSTPTNVIPYSAGYFTIAEMAKVGIVMTVIASLCVAVSVWGVFAAIPWLLR